MTRLTVIEHALGQLTQLAVIARGQRGQRNLLITRIFEDGLSLLHQGFLGLAAQRAVGMTCLTETAATRTTAEQLDHRTVKHDIGRGNDKIIRIVHGIQIAYNALLYECRCAVLGRDCLDRTVFLIADLIECRNVHTGNLGRFHQEFVLGQTTLYCTLIEIGKIEHDLLAVTDHEQIDKIAERFRVIGTRAAGDNQIFKARTILGQNRHAAQIQHVQNIGKRQLVLQRKADDIKIRQRIAALQTVQRNSCAAHLVFHVNPGCKDALTPDVLLIVEQSVQNARTQMGHTDFINVGETERKA